MKSRKNMFFTLFVFHTFRFFSTSFNQGSSNRCLVVGAEKPHPYSADRVLFVLVGGIRLVSFFYTGICANPK